MSNFKNNTLSLVRFLVGWPLSFISILFIIKIIFSNSFSVTSSIKNLNFPFLIIGMICFFAYFFLRSFFWQKIIQAKGTEISFKEISYYFGFSEIKRYVPGNIWSFLSRSYFFKQKNVENKVILHSLLIEIELIILCCLALSIPAIELLGHSNLAYLLSVLSFLLAFLFFIFGAIIFKKLPVKNLYLKKIAVVFPNFSPLTNFYLFLISLTAFFFFGLASYFAMVSIVEINIYYISQYISIFIFSLLVGYLSIITPMGLGVREGVITYGLSKFISTSFAGMVAIFARVTFILSEILFLIFIFIWKKNKNRFLSKLENFISNNRYGLFLLISAIIYIIYFTAASFLRYDNFFTGRFDLGNMDQAVWNTMHGRIFQITDPNGTNIISRLAFHADFILILISPLYFIWRDPKALLLLQTVVLAFGALFLYLLSKNVLKNKNISLIISLAFLLNPSVQYSNLYDFHPVTLATTFLLAATYFFVRKKYLFFILFAVFAGLTKEEVWAVISIFGLYLALNSVVKLVRKDALSKAKIIMQFLLGTLLFLTCFAIFYYLIWYAIPHARGGNHFALSYYSDFGYSPSSIIKNILLSPVKTLQIIFSKNQLNYLFQIFIPVGFLSFLAPIALIFAGPDLVINLLSNNSQLHEIYFQYTATITPFIFISTIYGVKRLKKVFPNIPLNFYTFFLIAATLFSVFYYGPLPGTRRQGVEMFMNTLPDKKIIDDFLKNVPPRYSIAATNNLGSHLSRRQKIFTVPVGIDKADVVLFLLNDKFAQPSLSAQIEIANKLKQNKNYVEIFRRGDFVVFEKKNLYLEKKPNVKQVNLFPWSITSLQNREYTDSQVVIERKVSSSKNFSSFIVSYLSDGLKIYALMNVPNTKTPEGGFPVVIINHGFIEPTSYNTVNSYKQITDYFSDKGYLVLKPDYRGNGASETEDKALMRFAYPVDVLNLMKSLKNIPQANSNQIYLYGHSMGGEIVLKILEIAGKDPETLAKIKAAVVWAPVTNLSDWFSKSHVPWLQETKNNKNYYAETFKIIKTPEEDPMLWQSVSPVNYLQDIQTPVLISHGTSDGTVSYSTSIELYDSLISLNKTAELLLYPNNDHNLILSWDKASANSLSFFRKY